MARLFRDVPEAIAETMRFAEPHHLLARPAQIPVSRRAGAAGQDRAAHLEDLTWAGVARIFPGRIDDKLRATLRKELRADRRSSNTRIIFSPCTTSSAMRAAQNILCQGRGSAANSAVCYVLGITSVDPTKIDLLFERFISKERLEPPDIDVDFEHSRREEVMQYVYRRYGRHRAAIIATVIHYRPRSAIRDVGKALGLTEDVTAALADTVWGSWGKGLNEMQVRQAGLDPQNPMIELAVELATELIEFPRHLSQHVGGYVLTQDRLDTYVPIGNAAMDDRTFIEWDKDDVDALNMMKVDVLALGMLTCIRKCFDLIADHKGERYELADIKSQDDTEVYDMLQRGESLGVFQVESRAQMNMLPRLKPRKFYDLVIEVAIVRPGADPGRHGASLSAAAERPGEGELSVAVARARRQGRTAQGPAQDARRAAVPGTGDADRDRGREVHPRGGQRLAPRDGDVPQCRHHRQIRRQDDRQHDRARLRSRIREKLLRPDQGIWQLRFSGKPCRELCATGLCLVMAEAFPSRRVLLRAAEFAADGLLRAGADRRRCPQERRRGARDRRVVQSRQNTLEEESGKYHAVRLGFRQIDGFQLGRSG